MTLYSTTTQEVAAPLNLINTEVELRILINQLDTIACGTKTVLLSRRIVETYTSAYINKLKNNPDIRILDNTETF